MATFRFGVTILFSLAVWSCGNNAPIVERVDAGPDTGASGGAGGRSGSGGTTGSGGSLGTGGRPNTGGAIGSGGAPGTGGRFSTGGTSGSGGASGSGGTTGSGGMAGTGGAGGACGNLSSPQCLATPGCSARTCPSCSGGTMFSGCFPTGAVSACIPLSGCPAGCSGLTETACRANPACRADSCPQCSGPPAFFGCSAIVSSPPVCVGVNCPVPVMCNQVTTLADCEARNDCHSVFFDSQLCGCATIGCCAHFVSCAAGNKAACAPTGTIVGCGAATPHCEGPYVVAYTSTCFEGCVQQTDCAP